MPNWLNTLKKGADAVGVLLFVAAFSGFILQVFFRYVINRPLLWTEEFMLIAFIWAVFWGAAFMVSYREHVTFDLVYDLAPPGVKRAMSIFAVLVLIVAFALLIPATLDYLEFLLRKRSPVMRIPMTWIYAGYFVFIITFTIQAGHRLWRMLGPDWAEHL